MRAAPYLTAMPSQPSSPTCATSPGCINAVVVSDLISAGPETVVPGGNPVSAWAATGRR